MMMMPINVEDDDANDDDDDDCNPSVQEVTKCRRSRHRRTRNNG